MAITNETLDQFDELSAAMLESPEPPDNLTMVLALAAYVVRVPELTAEVRRLWALANTDA